MADEPSTCYLVFIIVTVNFGTMTEGVSLGWSSPTLLKLMAPDSPIPITPDQSSWIAAVPALGEVIAVIFARNIIDRFGRRRSLLLTTVPLIISWIMVGVATTPEELYVARFIAGTGYATYLPTAMIYLGEITPARVRGLAFGLTAPCMMIGEMLSFAIGPRFTIYTTAWIFLALPVTFMFLAILLPESPYFLAMKGRFKGAEKSLSRLRGTVEAEKELKSLRATVEMNALKDGGIRDLLTKLTNLKILGIALGINILKQLSGFHAVTAYSHKILREANFGRTTDINLVPVTLAMVFSSVGAILVDRTGKKPILIFSIASTAMCCFIFATFFSLKSHGYNMQPYSWVPVAAFCAYMAASMIGLIPIFSTIASELFPLNVKAIGCSVSSCTNSLCHFAVVKLYQVVSDNFGIQTAFFGFTSFLTAGVFFVIYSVPETKGMTLEEIQRCLGNRTLEIHKMEPLITEGGQAGTSKRAVDE